MYLIGLLMEAELGQACLPRAFSYIVQTARIACRGPC